MTYPLAIVVSRFNADVTETLLQGALETLRKLQFDEKEITVIHVPGAIEIPLAAQRLSRSKRFKAIICLGAVIRGETDHYDYVCSQVSEGCQRVALDESIPVLFGILTGTEKQVWERAGGKEGNKGADAVNAMVEMVQALLKIDGSR